MRSWDAHFCARKPVAYVRSAETVSGKLISGVSVDQVTTARVGYLIKRAQSVLHDAMADALGLHDLTVTQFAVLTALDEEPGLSNADLARRAFVTPQSMYAVLLELERLQLVVRTPHPQHRGLGYAVEEQMLRQLSSPARSRLASALSSCIDSLAEPSPFSVGRRIR